MATKRKTKTSFWTSLYGLITIAATIIGTVITVANYLEKHPDNKAINNKNQQEISPMSKAEGGRR